MGVPMQGAQMVQGAQMLAMQGAQMVPMQGNMIQGNSPGMMAAVEVTPMAGPQVTGALPRCAPPSYSAHGFSPPPAQAAPMFPQMQVATDGGGFGAFAPPPMHS